MHDLNKQDQSTSSTALCNQCGSDLIVQETKVEQTEYSFSPSTITIYRCSNQACQEEIDKKIAKRLELKREQELAKQKRLEKIHLNHKNRTID